MIYEYSNNGNKFVILNNLTGYFRDDELLAVSTSLMRLDGVLTIGRSYNAFCYMRIFNADGSEANLCGNGLICVAKFIKDHLEKNAESLSIETNSGIFNVCFNDDGSVSVHGLNATVHDTEIFGGYEYVNVDIGNNHAVIFVDDVDSFDLEIVGPLINFRFEDGVNVEVAHCDGNIVKMRVWERGVGITQSCGTGSCAVVAALVKSGRANPGKFHVNGNSFVTISPLNDRYAITLSSST